jgi:hypothetical protein
MYRVASARLRDLFMIKLTGGRLAVTQTLRHLAPHPLFFSFPFIANLSDPFIHYHPLSYDPKTAGTVMRSVFPEIPRIGGLPLVPRTPSPTLVVYPQAFTSIMGIWKGRRPERSAAGLLR